MQQLLKLTVLFIFLSGCNTYKTKYPYSLDDFRPELRKHLEKIISNPFPDNIDEAAANYLDNHTSEKELLKILKSEHPILRATAFKYLSLRKSVDFSKILIEGLDDTAFISSYTGDITTVADYCIDKSEGHSTILKSDLMDEVITNHPYLYYAAHFFQLKSLAKEKYYPALKKIITAEYPLHSRLRRELIMKLSTYKKNDDTGFIAQRLRNSRAQDGPANFTLIENNPIDEYFFLIERFYNKILFFYQRKSLQAEFFRYENFNEAFENFILATAAYKSKRSADILKDILNRKLYNRSNNDKDNYDDINFQHTLAEALKKYNCIFYATLLARTEAAVNIYNKTHIMATMETYTDSIPEKKTW